MKREVSFFTFLAAHQMGVLGLGMKNNCLDFLSSISVFCDQSIALTS
jgi:hypothetical protein